MLYIKIIIIVFLLFYSSFTQAGFEHLDVDNYMELKIKNSIVRIDLFSLNAQKKELKHIGYGHGVLISRTGLILTAAHVIFPPKKFDNAAVYYRIKISKWNESENKFEFFDQFDSDLLKNKVIYSTKLSLENWQPNPNFEPMIVQKNTFDREKDFALILTYKESCFIDVTGPLDELDPKRAVTKYWVKVVVSDFFKRSWIRDYKVIQPNNYKPFEFNITGQGKFHKGISGSPLLVMTLNKRVFVAGIVTEVIRKPTSIEQEDKLTQCNVSLINEVTRDIVDKLKLLSGEKKEFYDCKNRNYPYAEPLLNNYCIYLKKINMKKSIWGGNKLSEKDMNIILGCLKENTTWDSTMAIGGGPQNLDNMLSSESL